MTQKMVQKSKQRTTTRARREAYDQMDAQTEETAYKARQATRRARKLTSQVQAWLNEQNEV